jgi:hypothetical protein
VGIVPQARVDHLYDFTKRRVKWRLLERNRWASLLRVYPARVLALVMPALLATELGLLVAALRGGWLREKLAADLDVLRALPRLRRERQQVQRLRRVSDRAFAQAMVAELSSPYLGAAGRSRALNRALRAYWQLVLAILERSPSA